MKKDKKINLILGSHAHVPSGSDESEFERVYENKLRPFIINLFRHENIQAVLHYSGVLLHWVERTHPEFFMLIEDMVSRKQVEILSGGFYEPMLALISSQDRIGQIELLTTYLRKHFGKRPLGCWIPGMVWEQHLASSLSSCDMDYTFLSLDQFSQAGVKDDELYLPVISEDQGKVITIFPVSRLIEKDLGEKSFSHVFTMLKKKMDKENFPFNEKIICVFPEKISASADESPDMAWNRFFEEVSLSANFVETALPVKVYKNRKNHIKATFQNSSAFQNGFSPRGFIIERCEANGIYAKMVFINVLINQLKGDKSRKQNAREELWKAQDSVFFTPEKGCERHELRKAAYSSLLRAERLSREKGKFNQSIIQYDFDFDGVIEYLIQDEIINCYIQQKGAGIFELDYLPKDWNYLDAGSRKYPGNRFNERRASFIDAILPAGTKIESIENGYPENSRVLFRENYESIDQDRKGKICFKLAPAGNNTSFGCVEINKCFKIKKNALTVSYNLKNCGKDTVEFCFLPEINISLAGAGDNFARFFAVDSNDKEIPVKKLINNSASIKILDIKNEVQILIGSSILFSCLLIPSFVNGLYQTNQILPLFPVSLESGKSWVNEFSVKFNG